LVRQWARRGSRPRQPKDQRYQSLYLFGAICPARGTVLLLDRAGWHTTRELKIPKNITLLFLPSRSPELNPVENLWQFLRQTYLSNRVFQTYEDILDAACETWNRLVDQPWRIMSIGLCQWAHNSQSL
jgi:transposase